MLLYVKKNCEENTFYYLWTCWLSIFGSTSDACVLWCVVKYTFRFVSLCCVNVLRKHCAKPAPHSAVSFPNRFHIGLSKCWASRMPFDCIVLHPLLCDCVSDKQRSNARAIGAIRWVFYARMCPVCMCLSVQRAEILHLLARVSSSIQNNVSFFCFLFLS